MRSVVLPNGRVVNNVPDDVTDDEVISRALSTGAFKQENIKSSADLLPLVGEIAGGVGGSILGGMAAGAVAGSAAPGIGTLIGGLLGGAIGTFAGSYGGQVLEADAEQRVLDSQEAISKASTAAALDVAGGAAFGAFAHGIKAIGRPLLDLVSPALRPIDELDTAIELQRKLASYNTSLLPSQIGDTAAGSRVAEAYAASSIGFETQFKTMMEGYEQYASETAEKILQQLPEASRKDAGKAFLKLAGEAEKALGDYIDPLYKQLDIEGGLGVTTDTLKGIIEPFISGASKRAVAQTGGLTTFVPSKDVKKVVDFVSSLQDVYTPARLTRDVLPALSVLKKSVEGDSLAKAMVTRLENELGGVVNHPAMVKTGAVKTQAVGIGGNRINRLGQTGRSGPEREAYNYVQNLREGMSFSEARQELSYMKGKLRDIKGSPSGDSAAERIWASAVNTMEKEMENSSQRMGRSLYDKYRDVSTFYKTATETINAPYMRKAIKNNEVAKVAEMLTKTGEITPIEQVDELVTLAEKLGVQGGKDVRDQLTRKYLDSLLADPQIHNLNTLASKLKDERFLNTFDTVVSDKNLNKQIKTLFDEAHLVAKHGYGSSAAQSLSIRSRELTALTKPATWQQIVFGLAPDIVSRKLSNAQISARLGAIKSVREALQKGVEPPRPAMQFLLRTLPKAAVPTGFAFAAPLEQ